MPGSIKVSNTWRTSTGIYVKVGGTWRVVTSGYIKVGGTWKQWFASKIQDAFNRTSTVSGLGTADTGQAWVASRGNWRISGSNAAISDDSASSYAISSINLGNQDVKVQADVSGGTGVVFWLSDANSWWAAYPEYTSSTAYTCDQGQASCTGSGCTPSASCCSGVTQTTSNPCNQGNATCSGSGCTPSGCCSGVSYSGGGQACTGGLVTNTSNPPSANCCSGVSSSGGGTACTGGLVSNTSNPPSGSCCSGVSSSQTTSCNSGLVVGGTEIIPLCCESVSSTTVTSYSYPECATYAQCSGTVQGTTSGTICLGCYSAFSGCPTTYQGYAVTETPAPGFCACPTGSNKVSCSYVGTQTTTLSCSCTYSTAYSCRTSSSTVTTYSCYTSNVTQPTNYSCYTSYQTQPITGSCYTSTSTVITRYCYTSNSSVTTYNSKLIIASSVSGTVVAQSSLTLSSNTTGFSTVGSVYASTVGNTITARAYSGTGLTTQLGADLTYTATSPTKGTSVGIIKAPSAGSQGSTIDNFLGTI